MPSQPTTPDHAGARLMSMLSKPAVGVLSQGAGSMKDVHLSKEEPSPASTYGASNTTGSVPITPADAVYRDDVEGIIGALDSVSLGSDNCNAGTTGFVRRSGQNEDPFIANGSPATATSQNSTDTYPLRADRAGQIPSSSTAQAFFTPEACIFIANLAQNESDDTLDKEVKEKFSRFGAVHVKIRRDANGMPFAFGQYENVEDARQAIQHGRGLEICGRACRVEVAKVNRAAYLSKISGGHVGEEEARHVLADHGAIEDMWYSSPTDREINRLPEGGIWIRFHYYDDCRDAKNAFKDNSVYRLEQLRNSENRASSRSTPLKFAGYNVNSRIVSPAHSKSHGMPFPNSGTPEPVEYGLRHVFVGDLPTTVGQYQLIHMFSTFGSVVDVAIFHKASSGTPRRTIAFAFIEFQSHFSAARAVFEGQSIYPELRIEFKVPRRNTSPARRVFDPPMLMTAARPPAWQPIPPHMPTAPYNAASYGHPLTALNHPSGHQAMPQAGVAAYPYSSWNAAPANYATAIHGSAAQASSSPALFMDPSGYLQAMYPDPNDYAAVMGYMAIPNSEPAYTWPPVASDDNARST